MATTIQFVDSIVSSPGVRLDLNADPWQVTLDQLDLSPPPLRRSYAGTLLTDGVTIPASAYDNRILKMHLELVTTTQDLAATELQKLSRELNRSINILKYQPGTTAPVFFRTFRAPDFRWTLVRDSGAAYMYVDVEIPAEPFALGLQETPVSNVTINTNPAGGGNDCFVDVTGIKGDVETPAYIRFPAASALALRHTIFATRRRGTPSSAPFLIQAEAMTQGTNTTTQVNDANFSGAGNNYSRCTFATATMQNRLSVVDIGTAGVNLRGRYRVFMRYRKNTSTDAINVQLRWGSTDVDVAKRVTNTAVALPNDTAILGADLGEISIPFGYDPVTDPTGAEVAVSDVFELVVRAERTAGTGTLDMDFLLLIPADDRLAIVKWSEEGSSLNRLYLDANDNSVHGRDSTDQVIAADPPAVIGGLPMLTPNQTNRLYVVHHVGNLATWSLTTVANFYISYMPRYLSIRPVST